MNSEKERAEEAERIVNWAFRQFVQKTVAEKGTVLAQVPVWMGDQDQVGLELADDVSMLIPALVQGDIPGEISYRTPLQAPITAGQDLGELVITLDGLPPMRVPLVADRDVAKGGFMPRVRTAARVLIGRIAGSAQDAL